MLLTSIWYKLAGEMLVNTINWQNDPFLLDEKPISSDMWICANKFLAHGQAAKFLYSNGQLRLYPLLIRKIDFITGERLLQSFPYILLDLDWISRIRKRSLALAEKTHHYFVKANYNTSIRKWQKKIINYLEHQQRLPFPLFRLFDNWSDYFIRKEFVQFQSARGESFHLPLFLSEDLAYLTGVVMGDGHLAEYFINIIDASKEHIENLAKLLQKHFHSKIDIFKHPNANAWNVNILGKWVVRFFNFLSSQPVNARKYDALREPAIFSLANKTSLCLRSAFWRGLMDADGGYKTTIGLTSASKQLIEDFSSYLSQHKISFHLYNPKNKNTNAYVLNVSGKDRKSFTELIGTNHPEKKQELELLLTRKVYPFSPRAKTLLKHGSWVGQVQSFNLQKQQNDFFDFSQLTQFSISGTGVYIRNLRESSNQTQKTLATLLSISSSLLSKYERNSTSIPITLFIRLLTFYDQSFVNYLSKNKKIFLHSRSAKCKLDSQPNDFLLQLLKGLQLKSGNYFLIVGVEGNLLDDYKKSLCEYFSIPLPPTRILNNTVLNEFVRIFCILR